MNQHFLTNPILECSHAFHGAMTYRIVLRFRVSGVLSCRHPWSERRFWNSPWPPHLCYRLVSCTTSLLLLLLKQMNVQLDILFPPTEISDQCSPLPCYKEGYKRCVDGHGAYTCVCKPGWKGLQCEEGGCITLTRSLHLERDLGERHWSPFIRVNPLLASLGRFLIDQLIKILAPVIFWQILMSVRTQVSLLVVSRGARTHPGASSAFVIVVTTCMMGSIV